VGGSFELSDLLGQGDPILSSRWADIIVILVLIGAFTKSAQYPFHFWLPNAMAAPTPISAYLHSATMVKAGIYLIARLTPILGAVPIWQNLLVWIGLTTMLLGSLRALFNSDLKRILAYTTVSSLGTITFLFGIGTRLAVLAACGYILAHALYKGALFMIAGIVDHEAGGRDIAKLRGLHNKMPWTAAIASAAALSMIGIPPFFGFVIKDLVYEATLAAYLSPILLTTAAVTTNAALAAGALLVAWRPFAGKTVISPKHEPHDPKLGFLFAPLLLAVLGLLAGLTSGLISGDLIVASANSISASSTAAKLALWHGFNLPFILSLITVLAALLLFWNSPWSLRLRAFPADTFDCENLYRQTLSTLLRLAYFQTRLLQNGSLRTYLITILLVTVALVSLALLPIVNESIVLGRNFSITPWEVALAGFIIVGALAIIRSESRLGAVAALGVVGYGVALLFTLFGAPDLGITQFAIETLAVILFVFVLYRLPRFSRMTSTSERIRDLIVAGCFGLMMTLLILVVTAAPLSSRLSPFFAANSYLLAKGRNVVNVILVDFRALDTFGEITVITIAALGVFALLKLRMN
jgi:multicomponent Na+:H+ antiporter subunit A